jgi:hypothetical protein
VYGQCPLDIPAADEAVDLSIGIAGHVREHRPALRPFVESVYRHDREKLTDRPAVW